MQEYCSEVHMSSWTIEKDISVDWSCCCCSCCHYCVILLLFMCNCGDTQINNNNKITYEQQQQSGYDLLKIEQEIYVDWSYCCCCFSLWRDMYKWTTRRTKLHMINNYNKIILHLITLKGYNIVSDHVGQMCPLVEPSSSQRVVLHQFTLTCTVRHDLMLVRCTQFRCLMRKVVLYK